ncbi:Transient receptor putative cation channel sub A member 1 [Fusarium oxysporum]|nr:Transient receptor putative cation channel sub A member 1 [Fusarium oxysporum]
MNLALIAAASNGHSRALAILLKYSPDATETKEALIAAASNGHYLALAILLKHSPDATETKEALIAAASNGHSQALITLLRYGSHRKPVIKQAYRASVIGGQSASIRIIRRFLTVEDVTRFVNEFDDAGRTPLHWAIERNNKSSVLVLLQYGASVSFLDNHGLSPLMLAAQNQGYCSRGLAHAVAAVPVAASAPEMQMGVGFRGDVQATALLHAKTFLGIERQPDEAHIQLYETMAQAILESLESPDVFEITSNSSYGSRIDTWGECLMDSHVRFLLGPNLSVTLRLDRILGFGSGALGCDIIRMVRATEDNIGSRVRYFRLQNLLHASPSSKPEVFLSLKLLSWLYALIHSVCDQQIRRIGRLGSVTQDLPEFGGCWREAFGDPMLVDLRSVGTTKEIFNLGCSLDANVGWL